MQPETIAQDNPTLGVKMTDYGDPRSFGSRMRAKRARLLRAIIDHYHHFTGGVSILDIGGRQLYWRVLPREYLEARNVHITLLNLPGDLKINPDPLFTTTAGDACSMPQFQDFQFDIAHSNSVIEHVGSWTNVKRFAEEARRVATSLFIQTPNFWFPIEPHLVLPFFHWLPRPAQELLLLKVKHGHFGKRAANLDDAIAQVDAIPRLLNRTAYSLLFPDCQLYRERFLFMTKSFIAVRHTCATAQTGNYPQCTAVRAETCESSGPTQFTR